MTSFIETLENITHTYLENTTQSVVVWVGDYGEGQNAATIKGSKRTFFGHGYLDCDSLTGVYIGQNLLNCTLYTKATY